jgi:post-segregation antitoxin (ccd killing protein)
MTTRKQTANLSIQAAPTETAKKSEAAASVAIESAHEKRRKQWAIDNRRAIEAWNTWVEENGTPFEELRPW